LSTDPAPRRRADAQRNVGALLEAATTVFATAGVDAPAKDITDLAGVGVGTLYRHFPQRSDLVIAVLQREIDACAAAAPTLSAAHDPWTALTLWIARYTDLVGTKVGLASALQSSATAHRDLRTYFYKRMTPALTTLTTAANIHPNTAPADILHAVALLCHPVPGEPPTYGPHLVAIFVAGLRP
jgi:AcrR family transcriptional regulator